MSESESVRIGKCQNYLKLESVRIHQVWKVSELESIRNCLDWYSDDRKYVN